jgi:hypothetical protein
VTDDDLRRLHQDAEAALMRHAGVIGVGFGVKERGGQLTDEPAFRVYVREKKERAELDPADIVPATFQGVATDVLDACYLVKDAVESDACADHITHDPLLGGITIAVYGWTPGAGLEAGGTLGFLATIDKGAESPHNIAFVTNRHVVGPNAKPGTSVYQPPCEPRGGEWFLPRHPDNKWVVGKILAVPAIGDQPYAYQDDPKPLAYFVDCASVEVTLCISSWCNTNCDVGFSKEGAIRRLNVAGGNVLTGVARAESHNTVYKVGRATGRSRGTIAGVGDQLFDDNHNVVGNNVIVVDLDAPCDGAVNQFSTSGDSGAALVDDQGNLVGLVFGHHKKIPTRSFACHIHPVLHTLGVTPITTKNPVRGNPAGKTASAAIEIRLDGLPNQTASLRERFLGCPEGRRLAALVERDRREVVSLVNHNRRVTVAWHRNRGPAFLNRAIENARDPEVEIPREIDGVSRGQLLLAMERVLAEHGSETLGSAMQSHHDDVLAYVEQFDSLHDAVDHLAAEPVRSGEPA